MPTPVGLQVCSIGECELDLDEHLTAGRNGARHLLDPQVARAVQERRLHSV